MYNRLRSLAHSGLRFFEVGRARPLSTAQVAQLEPFFPDSHIREVFFQQSDADCQHGWQAWSYLRTAAPARPDLAQAALLHDLGKARSPLGIFARTAATCCRWIPKLPHSQAIADYLNHGQIGADLLQAAGAPLIVVEFARHHHQSRPETIPPEDWEKLQLSDRVHVRSRYRQPDGNHLILAE